MLVTICSVHRINDYKSEFYGVKFAFNNLT